MVTPLGKLTDLPTFKEKVRQQPHNINYGLVGYPVLMSADILLYKANAVPVGIDQAPHIEFARETVRSFNYRYNTTVLVEPEMKVTQIPKVIGIDGQQKMSKSLDNHIELAATPEETQKRVMSMVTDPQRKRRTDPGDPDVCNVFALHKIFSSPEEVADGQCGVPPGRDRLRGLQAPHGQEPERQPGAVPGQPGRVGPKARPGLAGFGRWRPARAQDRAANHGGSPPGDWPALKSGPGAVLPDRPRRKQAAATDIRRGCLF